MPLYQLLGGACRNGVLVYCHANGATTEETIEDARAHLAMGYTAIRLQSGVPGLKSTYGVSKDKLFYEPADADLPTENVWSSEKYLRSAPALFETAREALGWDVHLLHDVHHRLTPIEAARLGKDLEPYPPVLAGGCGARREPGRLSRLIRQHTTTPLAVGEVFNSIWDCKQLIEEQLIDYIRATVRARRRHHASAPHREPCRPLSRADRLSWRDRSVAGLHGGGAAFRPVGAEFRYAGIHAPHGRDRCGVPARLQFSDGTLHPGKQPGLGVDIDETLAAKYPVQTGLPAGEPPGRRHA